MSDNSTEAKQTHSLTPAYEITLYGNPLPQMRAKFSTRGKFVHTYDPMAKFKKNLQCFLALEVAKFEGSWPLQGGVHVQMAFDMPIAKSDPSAIRNLKLWGFLDHTIKADYDNLAKTIGDIGNGILWQDDKQITFAKAKKKYALCPCTKILITPITQIMDDKLKKVFEIFSPQDIFDMRCLFSSLSESVQEETMEQTAYTLLIFAKKFSSKLRKLEKLDAP